jgi:hypothetical protein
MPDTSPDDAATLTALLGDYGGLWDITKTPRGYQAKRRPLPAPPLILTAPTVPALRELLEHGYDTRTLAAIMADHGTHWEIEHLSPGSAWVAISHGGGCTRVITASDLGNLRSSLGHVEADPD